MASAAFGRLRIHYKAYGSGPPLLLVHGLMTSSYSWRYLLDELGGRFRLVVPDLPGCGRSAKPVDRPYQPAALATWIGEFQAGLEWSQPLDSFGDAILFIRGAFELQGWSYGGVTLPAPVFESLDENVDFIGGTVTVGFMR